MLTNLVNTMAAPRPRSESPVVLPTGSQMTWQGPASVPADAVGFVGFAQHTSSHDATLSVITPALTVGADSGVTAKQDRPPRGVPR